MKESDKHRPSAYGGSIWSPREASLKEELGTVWAECGVSSEWKTLKSVLLHPPGEEIEQVDDPDQVQFVARPDPNKSRRQHAALANCYRSAGVRVHTISPEESPPPNLMFVADLFFMTPEGAIIGRPASTTRAGEEVHLARRLSLLNVPILTSIRGKGTFEGADAAWLDEKTVLIGTGLRTNQEGASQVQDVLSWLGVQTIIVELLEGTMHLMGVLRFLDERTAVGWPGRIPESAIAALETFGYRLEYLPDQVEADYGHALNFVTLGPRRILAPGGNPNTQRFFETLGVQCDTVDVSELTKAAGAIGCLTGVLERVEG